MAATVELLDFLAPAVAGMSAEDKQKALDIAADYRPACLPEAKQDEAQAWYAAWLLYGRLQQQAAQDSGGVAPAGVVSEKEGDLSRTYGRAAGADDPAGFYGNYDRLARLCRAGAIIVGTRRRYGCC
ncbi:DUF4054 domain-containing protein [Bordetella petrii]|uniref:DUF4054 domain-containing protein n=1 Tax=Bordetella petrii (strain ATCC BAA-461 / DSM 12804 / CCUG 43448 / CIP 107267 / Se-1111R) TaxID=340100 RepID=A9I912_BORPD|nr:DUF4054 domain-containing protein [Bordetella petrii]CAP41315.1 hypothetical protein predicted by Glimmer/Critica [Bordetella petrii]